MSIALVFPGQGSQSVGMQGELAEKYDVVSHTYAEASKILGYDLWEVTQYGPAERLNESTVTQPAMLTAGVAAYRIWASQEISDPVCMAGHSLGEYTALVCAGSLDFEEALALVRERAKLMYDAVAPGIGAMAAIIGLDDHAVIRLCEEASGVGVAEPVNFNSPGQIVIAGHKEAVKRAINRAEDAGARRAIMLKVSVPSHSSLMVDAGVALGAKLADIDILLPKLAVYNATTAQPYDGPEDIREHLARQVHSPVRWVDTVNAIVGNGATQIVECGPGRVLAGLTRRIARELRVDSLDSIAGLDKALRI